MSFWSMEERWLDPDVSVFSDYSDSYRYDDWDRWEDEYEREYEEDDDD